MIMSLSLSKSNSKHPTKPRRDESGSGKKPGKQRDKRGTGRNPRPETDQASASARKEKRIPFPTKDQVLDFIRTSPVPAGKREIARAFNLRGSDRIPLKALIKELEKEGAVDRGRARRLPRLRGRP